MDKPDAILLNSLRVFMAVAENCSFTKAASQLCLTVSAISQTVKKLEAHIGCNLLLRAAHQVTLTAAGEILFSHGEQALDTLAQGLQKITRLGQEQPLRIFSPPGVSSFLLNQQLLGLLSDHVATIEMVAKEEMPESPYSDWDMAILLDPRLKASETLTALGEDIYFPFCHPSLAARMTEVSDLFQFPLLYNQHGMANWEQWFAINGVAASGVKKIVYSRASQLLAAVESGSGIGFESLRVLSGKLNNGDFILCPLPGMKPVQQQVMWLYLNPHSPLHAIIPDLRQRILSAFSMPNALDSWLATRTESGKRTLTG